MIVGLVHGLPVLVLASVVGLFNSTAGWVVLGVGVIVAGVVAEIRAGSRPDQR